MPTGARPPGTIPARMAAGGPGAGPVVRGASIDDDALGWVVTDDQNPPRARLLAALALTRGGDPTAVQRVFLRY